MSSYSKSGFAKKFVTNFMRDSISARALSIVMAYKTPLGEVKEPNSDTYISITINPYNYTIEEQIMLYPSVVVHKYPVSQNAVIDIE